MTWSHLICCTSFRSLRHTITPIGNFLLSHRVAAEWEGETGKGGEEGERGVTEEGGGREGRRGEREKREWGEEDIIFAPQNIAIVRDRRLCY